MNTKHSPIEVAVYEQLMFSTKNGLLDIVQVAQLPLEVADENRSTLSFPDVLQLYRALATSTNLVRELAALEQIAKRNEAILHHLASKETNVQ